MPYRRFDLKSVAAYLHLPVADVEALVHHNEIPFERHGEKAVFLKKEVDAWASQRILGLNAKRLQTYHKASTARMHNLSKRHAIIRELVHKESLQPALASRTKAAVIRDIARIAEGTGLVMYPDELLASLQERESLCSTGLPGGLALPHPRHHDPYIFTDSFIILARTVHPIPFGAMDGHPTDLFFLVCCQDDQIHLHVLARLCMMCVQTKLIARLRDALDSNSLFASLVQSEEEVIALA